jgi:glucosamine 6-phosphate synthetase-like amidotransferase/phosphosugar isomerase protein
MITLSQSGETADTLAALRLSKELGYLGRWRFVTCLAHRWCVSPIWR